MTLTDYEWLSEIFDDMKAMTSRGLELLVMCPTPIKGLTVAVGLFNGSIGTVDWSVGVCMCMLISRMHLVIYSASLLSTSRHCVFSISSSVRRCENERRRIQNVTHQCAPTAFGQDCQN